MSAYRFQILTGDVWSTLIESKRGFCMGYLLCYHDSPGPRLEARVLGPTGKVINSTRARPEVSIGMVAGWPTAEQYEAAASRALELAKDIREREAFAAARELQSGKIDDTGSP